MNDKNSPLTENLKLPTCQNIVDPFGSEIYFIGPKLEAGELPAFFYFSISGEESLTLPPYNSPALFLSSSRLRIFSFTLPCHGPGFDKFKAMECWRDKFIAQEPFLNIFLDSAQRSIQWLIEQKIIPSDNIAAGGLSRGAFIATHLASLEKRIKYLLGYAPLTVLTKVMEFDDSFPMNQLIQWDLTQKIDSLLHLKGLRFYCGLNDTLIGTSECFSFVEQLAKVAYEKRVRDLSAELFLKTSIGHKGHGTSPETFLEGSQWVKNHLL